MQKVKDRKAQIEQRKEEKKAMMDQIEEAETMKKRSMFQDYDSDDESVEEEDEVDVKVEMFEDESTQNQFGGQVIVTTSYGLPDDSDDEAVKPKGNNIDMEQRYAGSVKKYVDRLKKKMPAKGAKFTNNNSSAKAGKKGKHGAEGMIGGNSKDLKMAKKTLVRAEGLAKGKGGKTEERGKKGKKGKPEKGKGRR